MEIAARIFYVLFVTYHHTLSYILDQQKHVSAARQFLMEYYDDDDDDEHDEDDLPEVSLSMPHYTRKISNNNDEQEDNQSNKTLESK